MSNKDILDFLNVTKWHDAGYKGQGVKVLMVDDGWEDRPWFDGKLHIVYSNGLSKSEHGLKTAETLHIVAPEAEIYCHEVSYPAYPTPIDVLKYVIGNDIQIVSMSMGGSIFNFPLFQDFLEEACKNTLFFTSAGNSGGQMNGAAVDDKHWISVGAAYLQKGKVYKESYSSIGESLDVMGLTGIEVHTSKEGYYFTPEGTSFSCPVVAGMMALYYSWFYDQYGRYPTPNEAKAFLFANCMDMEAQGRDNYTGHGLFVLPEKIPERKEEEPELKPQEFIALVKPGAVESYRQYRILPSITIAQAALESAWGRSHIQYNLFGIKWTEGCGFAKVARETTEYVNGIAKKVVAYFRGYKNFTESILDHAKLLNTARYEKVRQANNYNEAAQALQICGYATDPNYADKLISIINSYKLYEIDREVQTVSKVQTDWEGHPLSWGIKTVIEKGIMVGDKEDGSKFRPNDNLTRAEFANAIAMLFAKGYLK